MVTPEHAQLHALPSSYGTAATCQGMLPEVRFRCWLWLLRSAVVLSTKPTPGCTVTCICILVECMYLVGFHMEHELVQGV